MSMYSYQRDAVRDLAINALTEYPLSEQNVIYSHQSSPVPNSTYLTINILSTEQEGRTQQSGLLDEEGNIHYLTPYRMRVSFQTTGNNAGNVSHSLYQRLGNSASNRELGSLSKISVLQKTSLRRNPFKIDTKWIEVFEFSVDFYFISHFSESVQAVVTAVVSRVIVI